MCYFQIKNLKDYTSNNMFGSQRAKSKLQKERAAAQNSRSLQKKGNFY